MAAFLALLCGAWLAAPPGQGSEAAQLAQRFDPAQDVGFDQRLGDALPLELAFRTEDGAERRLGDCLLPGKPVLLALVYYRCPMLCDLVQQGIVDALRRVPLEAGRDFAVVFASIDPRETSELAAAKKAEALAAYAAGDLGRAPHADGWRFLTGSQAAIDALAQRVGFRYVYDEKIGEYAHAGGFLLATPAGKLSHYFFGAVFEPVDLRLALVAASNGTLGGLRERFLLLCYHWNPSAGRYGLAILNGTRAAGLATVAALAALVAGLLRRERRARQEPQERRAS